MCPFSTVIVCKIGKSSSRPVAQTLVCTWVRTTSGLVALRKACSTNSNRREVLGFRRIGTEVSFDVHGLLFGRSVRGIVQGDSVPSVFIPRLVELFEQGRFPIDKLIKTRTFEDINPSPWPRTLRRG